MKLIWKILIVYEIILIVAFFVGYAIYENKVAEKNKKLQTSCNLPEATQSTNLTEAINQMMNYSAET